MLSGKSRTLLACAAILATLPLTAGAINLQSYTSIYYPSSAFTLVKGVNDSGQIVGEYWTGSPGSYTTHAFYYDGADYYNIDRDTSATVNEAWGINNSAQIAASGATGGSFYGYYGDWNNTSDFGLLPGTNFNELFDINDAGMMVGGYGVGSTYNAFIYDTTLDSYSTVSMPNATTTTAIGINNANQVVGTYRDSSNNYHGFLFDGTGYTSIDMPGATLTEALGINNNGQVVGYYKDSNLLTHGYIFDIFSQVFTTLDIPELGSYGTRLFDISDNGLLVGGYFDGSDFHYGFTATMVPIPPALLLFGSGLLGLFGMTRTGKRRVQAI